MSMSLFQWIPSIGAFLLQIALLVVLKQRKLKAGLPIFFNFVVLQAISLLVLFVMSPRLGSMSYFYTYWTLNALMMIVTFGVLFEVFVHTLKPFSALIDLGKLLFTWAAGFLLIGSVLTAAATSGNHSMKICAAITLLERSVALMQCGLLLLLMLFENRLGLSWRNHGMSIALALGITAAMELVLSVVGEKVTAWGPILNNIDGCVYFAMWSFWFVMFWLPQPERKTAQDSPTKLIFQRWNDVLAGTPIVSQPQYALAGADSFLPSVERTVERVMARKMVN